MNKRQRIERAANHINAVKSGGWWYHYANETGRWYRVTANKLAELCDYLDDSDSSNAYSHWCAGTTAYEMPESWTPMTARPASSEVFTSHRLQQRIERAANHVNAVKSGGRWYHYANETGRWYRVTANELAELCDYLDDSDSSNAYSHWCAGTTAYEMPESWTPWRTEFSAKVCAECSRLNGGDRQNCHHCGAMHWRTYE